MQSVCYLCLFADDFICDLVRQRQNALQPIEPVRTRPTAFGRIWFVPAKAASPVFMVRLERERTLNVTLETLKAALVNAFD
jgi:hypothetical protein